MIYRATRRTAIGCLAALAVLAPVASPIEGNRPSGQSAGAAAAGDESPVANQKSPAREQEQREETAPPTQEEELGEPPVPSTPEEVVIVATRTRRPPFDVPYVTEELDSEQIVSRTLAPNFPAALEDLPAVEIQKTGPGWGSPFIRGFTGFRNLLLIDGIRLNNSVFRDGPNQYWTTVDAYSIDRIEMVKGASSVLFGTDAVGGTVNVVPRSRRDFPDGYHVSGRAFYRFESADDSHQVRNELEGNIGQTLGFFAGVTFKRFDDLSGGRQVGLQPGTDYQEQAGDTSLNLLLADNLDLTVAYQLMDQDEIPRTHSTVDAVSWRGTTVGTDLKRDFDERRDLAYARLRADGVEGLLDEATLTLSWQRLQERENRIRSDGRRTRQGFDVDTFGVLLDFALPETRLGTIRFGGEYYRDLVDSERTDFNADGSLREAFPRGPVADDSTYDLLGFYLQDELELTEDLELIWGGRYSYTRIDAEDVDPDPTDPVPFGSFDDDFQTLIGSARLLYKIDAHWHPYAGVSQAFRAPNLSDTTRFDVARSGEVEILATDLDPEEFLTYEVGLKTRFERLSASAAFFYTDIDGLIVRFPTGQTIDGMPAVTKDNAGDGYLYGVEAQAHADLTSHLSLFGGFAWLIGNVDTFVGVGVEDSEPISRLPPAIGHLGVRYERTDPDWWLEGTVTIADDQDRLSPGDERDTQRIPPGGTPGYTVFNLRGGVALGSQVRLTAAVLNVTDRDYRIHGSGLNEAGTSFVLGTEVRF